jgi:hypothetical protein
VAGEAYSKPITSKNSVAAMPIDVESITTIIKDGMPALEILAGSKAAAMFIEKVSSALGWYTEPKQIERKARAESKAALIKAEGEKEIQALNARTVARMAHEEVRQQQNMESVVLNAIAGIEEDAKPNEVEEDWLTDFFDKARKVSNEDVQKLWSQILAGEVNRPGTFSLRTLDALSKMNKMEAELFKKLCSFIWIDDKGEVFVIAPNGIIANKEFYLSGGELYHLEEINIALYIYGKEVTISDKSITLFHQGRSFKLHTAKKGGALIDEINQLPMGHLKLTHIGGELARISQGELNWVYMEKVIERWKLLGFEAVEIK